jgi:multicomponent Na+:H+ antiporter subunit B
LTVERERSRNAGRWLGLGVVTITVLVLIYATFDKPRLGDPDAPVHQHVAPWYLEKTPELIGIPNVVTAVLGSFRGYDTLGEVFVVLAACIGVLFILGTAPPSHRMPREADSGALRHHVVPQVVGRLLVPFIVLFGLYVQFHGEYGPGGGFQAGAIIATGLILHALLEGEATALRSIPRGVLLGMVAGGALLYTLVGITGIALGGNFLDYSVLADNPVKGQQIGILAIEAGVGVTVCGALLSIFHAFAARD